MKQKLIKIMRNMNFFKIMCCALCMMLFVPQTSKAEKVQYGKYITYDGKVDANKKPNGKGKLELAYKVQGVVGLETNKDVLEGVFADGKVSNAKLAIAKFNGPLWINSAKFKGTLEFTIADDGSSITYNLLEGELETKDKIFIISSEIPLTITRIPHPDGCETKAGKLFKANYNSSLSVNNIPNGYFYPLNLSELGNIKNIKKHTTYVLDADFSTRESGTEYSVELENGGVLSKSNDGISFTLPNKDFFYITSSNVQGYKFKKTLQEGVLSYEEGDFYLLKGENGKKNGVIAKTQDDAQKVFMKIMNATTLQSVGGTLYEGQIAELMEKALSGDSQAQYDLAMIFMEGNGVEKNENEGKKWLDKAVENGNESAIARMKAEEAKELEAKKAKTAAQMKAQKAVDATYMKMETVKDLSHLAMSNTLITEAKKLTGGGDYINGNFRLKVPIRAVVALNDKNIVDPSTSSATIELMDFSDQGKTVLITLDIPELGEFLNFTISGKNVKLGTGRDNDVDMFIVVKGNKPISTIGRTEGQWVYMISTFDDIISDLYRGMTISEVESIAKKMGLSSFKQTGKTTKYTIYSIYWLDMRKQYNASRTDYQYQVRNDKKYADFSFDAQGRLMKWINFF